jgi:imidazolonepropionase
MRKVTLVRGARQLLTLRGPSGPRRGADLRNLGIIQDGAVLIADGLIVEVGPSRRLDNLAAARAAEEIDASGCVVLPGFVDSHIHVVRGSTRDLSPRAMKTLALRVLEEAVRCGTTALETKSGLGITEAVELKILRVHAALAELPLTLVSTFLAGGVTGAARQAAFAERLLPMVRRRKLAEFAEIGCEAEARHFLTLARELGLGVKVSGGAIAMAAQIGATSVDDVVDAGERDAMLLAQSHTIATMSPGLAFHQEAARYAPARLLIDSGAAVALATGVHPPNLQMTIALACNAMHMTPAEAIAASTINGAHAMGRAGSIGSIEAGKSADLTILGVPDYRELPYHFGVNLVNLVMIRGAVLVERSEVKWPAR